MVGNGCVQVEVEHSFHFGRGKDPTTPPDQKVNTSFLSVQSSPLAATNLKPQQRNNNNNFNIHYKRFKFYKRTIVFLTPVNKFIVEFLAVH